MPFGYQTLLLSGCLYAPIIQNDKGHSTIFETRLRDTVTMSFEPAKVVHQRVVVGSDQPVGWYPSKHPVGW